MCSCKHVLDKINSSYKTFAQSTWTALWFSIFILNWTGSKYYFPFVVVSCSKFVWITNCSDNRRIWTALYARYLQFKPFCGPWNLWSKQISRRTPQQLKLGSKLKYLDFPFVFEIIIPHTCGPRKDNFSSIVQKIH